MNDGGTAFPALVTGKLNNSGKWIPDSTDGMSLRDWFAGQALVGMLMTGSTNIDLIINGKTQKHNIPQAAFAIADAMLEARKEK